MKVIAIIPARGGSKGIPRKNLAVINGKPLLAHSIEHALSADTVERVLVSSEDEEILETARRWGAETPFIRPRELAGDHVLDWPVFEHALRFLKEQEKYEPDLVVHLRPTTPFRRAHWIDEAVKSLWDRPDADSLRSVSPPAQHPYRVFRIGPDGFLDPIMKNEHPMPYLLRRQELPAMYYYNCVIDVTRPSTVFVKQSMTGETILPYVMQADESLDIDSPRDLLTARFLMETQPEFGGSDGDMQ